MDMIKTTDQLAAFCGRARQCDYVTVDTEFMRERTYYSKLCLVQIALPERGDGDAVLVDALAEGLSLEPLHDLFRDVSVVKVFHAARQDLEIFCIEAGVIPEPLFDTQVAAMVCGFGEQAGYETLVRKIAKQSINKDSRFSDWSRRPLGDAQMKYALADVTHLRDIYERLSERIEKTGRTGWVEEEMETLRSPETYIVRPEEAWRRLKIRGGASPKAIVAAKELARFREERAQSRNIPRGRVFKDEALMELANARPKAPGDLARLRLLPREWRGGKLANALLEVVAAAESIPVEKAPESESPRSKVQVDQPVADLLRVLLKARAEAFDVAGKLIASAADLDALSSGERDLPALSGWRRDVFGADALRLCAGEVALAVRGGRIVLEEIQPASETDAAPNETSVGSASS